MNVCNRPHVFWLFGLSGAGKSTLAESLRGELSGTLNAMPLMLDGDRLRGGLCLDLGFSDADRAENLRRAAEVARLGVESGHVVIAAFITSREENRLMIEKIIGKEWISLIHVDASLDVCRERDVKGLYARALTGEVQWMTGLTAAFDPPSRCALQLETGTEEPKVSATKLLGFARQMIEVRNERWDLQAAAV